MSNKSVERFKKSQRHADSRKKELMAETFVKDIKSFLIVGQMTSAFVCLQQRIKPLIGMSTTWYVPFFANET